MQAIVVAREGDPFDVLARCDVAEPIARVGEVVVAVEARPIHPADLAFVRGTYRIRPVMPQVAGLSGLGRVIGSHPSWRLAAGSRVAFRWPGAWAERVAVPLDRLYVLPDDVSDDDGAQLPLNPITAWGLLEMANVRAGQWIGLTAPNSSVSQLAAVLAELRGARPISIATTNEPGLADRVREQTSGEGLAALLDSVGGSLVEALFRALRPGATIVAYGTMRDEPIQVRNATLVYSNLTWRGFGIDRWLSEIDSDARARMLDVLYQAMRARRLPLPVRARFPLADFRRALRLAQDRGSGKVLLAEPRGTR